MGETLRQRMAARRVRDGDGRPLPKYRWWQLLSRSLFSLRIDEGGREVVYTVDVRHNGDASDGEVRARLYIDGWQQAVSKTPARFPVAGGAIEVATTSFGLRRIHYVTRGGREHQLTPVARSGAGRRMRFHREHPALSRAIGVFSVLFLLVGVVLLGLQLAEVVSEIPPVAERFGVFTSPVVLPIWLNIALGAGAAIASTERALRLRYHWLLDALGN